MACGIKARCVKFALTQVLVAGHQTTAHIARIPNCGGNKFVDVLVAGVTAHVKGQGLARLGQAANGGFVGKTAHGHAFGRRGIGGQRIDFDVVTKGVGFVAEVTLGIGACGRQIPAGKTVVGDRHGVPALADGSLHTSSGRRSSDAVTTPCRHFFGRDAGARARGLEVKGPVFFTTQIGAPRGFAVATIVQSATRHGASRVPTGHHEAADVVDLSTWAADAGRCLGGDAAVQRRVLLDAPALWGFDDFHHRNAVVIDFLEHFQFRAVTQIPVSKLVEFFATHAIGGLTIGVHKVRIGRAFVVNAQHSAARFILGVTAIGIDVVDVHAIVVVTNAARPVVGLSALVGVGGEC